MKATKMSVIAEVKNVPDDVDTEGYMVVRVYEGELWYYGIWYNRDYAERAMSEIDNGILLFLGDSE